MKKWTVYLLCAVFFLLGAMATYIFVNYQHNKISSKWFSFQLVRSQFKTGDKIPIWYDLDAIASDIKLPDITKVDLRAKVIDAATLGYIAEIEVEKLDTTLIPEKYRKELNVYYDDGSLMSNRGPIEEVVYEMEMDIVLFDKDNFELCILSTPKHNIKSGQINKYQDTIKDLTLSGIAKRIKKIDVQLSILRCITCEKDEEQ